MNKIDSILFVCTGNSCRSVMAEGLLKKRLKDLGKAGIKVESAGIISMGGQPPTPETIEVMAAEGVDVKSHLSKGLTDELIRRADLILVMEALHKEEVLKRVPEARSKTYLLKEFGVPGKEALAAPADVPDPIGRSREIYKSCFETIKKEAERIAGLL